LKKDDLSEIAAVLAEMRRPEEVRDWLLALLTPCERGRLCLRWRLVCMLADGVPQREIAKRLGISLCKITRGSRELKRGPVLFRQMVERRTGRRRKNVSKKQIGVKL
jgi:TrpR family trp operon transcriptional repressor